MISVFRGPLRQVGGGGGGGDVIIDAGGADLITFVAAAAVAVTNAPDEITEVSTARRVYANLVGRKSIQLMLGGTVPFPGTCRIRVSIDNGNTFNDFTSPCTCSGASLAAGTSTSLGTAVAIPEIYRVTNAMLQWDTDGDATPTEDPAFTTVAILVTSVDP